jgi:hypothetical protein
MSKIKLVYISLALGILSFFHFLGIEKAALAVIIGILALRAEPENKTAAWIGISLGLAYVVLVAVILIAGMPKILQYLKSM